jgi:hypothetical protein
MTWSDIGVLAELLGAIGVIASLIYLSRQVRQNTRAVRMANAPSGTRWSNEDIVGKDARAMAHGLRRSASQKERRFEIAV